MKNFIIGIFCMNLFTFSVTAQNITDKTSAQSNVSEFLIAEASCGQCNFNLPGKGCDLAVKINEVAYFVDGTKIDDHGDAHAADGFCTAIRMAHVKGVVVNNRFKSNYFKLIPLAKVENEKK